MALDFTWTKDFCAVMFIVFDEMNYSTSIFLLSCLHLEQIVYARFSRNPEISDHMVQVHRNLTIIIEYRWSECDLLILFAFLADYLRGFRWKSEVQFKLQTERCHSNVHTTVGSASINALLQTIYRIKIVANISKTNINKLNTNLTICRCHLARSLYTSRKSTSTFSDHICQY